MERLIKQNGERYSTPNKKVRVQTEENRKRRKNKL